MDRTNEGNEYFRSPETTNTTHSAIDVIKGYHREVEHLLDRLALADADKEQVFDRLSRKLSHLMTMEERHFYPAIHLHGGEQGRLFVAESIDDQRLIRSLLVGLQAEAPGSERWLKLKSQLEEDVLHYLQEEETDLLPLAEACLEDDFLVQKGQAMLSDSVA